MPDTMDDRRKGLEAEYFHRKEQEALERLRALRAQMGSPEREAGSRQCPLGHGALREVALDEVFIDRCDQCQGVWLDAGELEQLTRHEASGNWFFRLFGKEEKE